MHIKLHELYQDFLYEFELFALKSLIITLSELVFPCLQHVLEDAFLLAFLLSVLRLRVLFQHFG